ncbi:MAG: hypothetical protein K2K53_10930, partial [Oscillospiraceae bacterium]|nr:hypothetical protein [Oscillospiraceae bacterium]
LYNDLTVTVTSPSGNETTTYTFHVQRLTEPTMTQNPGNTPFGMIDRDTSLQWGGSATEIVTNKQAAKDYFKEHYKFSSSNQMYPHDDQNNGGSIFREAYSPKAWGPHGTNVDMDSEAIVVYQNSAFLDPGITITDAEGKKVTIGGSDYIVERSLQLRTADKLSIASVGNDVGTKCWYANGKLVTTEAWETLCQAGGTDQINLRGLYVLPGIYTLEYRYTDTMSGKTYGSDGTGFVTDSGREGKDAFRRTVVVLPMPGDVDMDGAVTSADAVALSKGFGYDQIYGEQTFNGKRLSVDTAAALFAYRVGNEDHDDDMGADDIALLEALPHPQLISAANASN